MIVHCGPSSRLPHRLSVRRLRPFLRHVVHRRRDPRRVSGTQSSRRRSDGERTWPLAHEGRSVELGRRVECATDCSLGHSLRPPHAGSGRLAGIDCYEHLSSPKRLREASLHKGRAIPCPVAAPSARRRGPGAVRAPPAARKVGDPARDGPPCGAMPARPPAPATPAAAVEDPAQGLRRRPASARPRSSPIAQGPPGIRCAGPGGLVQAPCPRAAPQPPHGGPGRGRRSWRDPP